MKIQSQILALLVCVLSSACVPGKFASRVDGIVIDSKSSDVVSGARLVSVIPHRGDPVGATEVVSITDENGRFSFSPEYGIFKLLTPDADWRQIAISREGYERTKVFISQQGRERFVTFGNSKEATRTSTTETLRIKLKKNG